MSTEKNHQATYTVERVDSEGRIITGYQHDVVAHSMQEAFDLWQEYYQEYDWHAVVEERQEI